MSRREPTLIRAIFNTVFFIVATFVGSILSVAVWPFDRTGDRVLWLARVWSRVVTGFAGVRITVEGGQDLAPDRPYVFMANHASTVDIWALFVAIPVKLRMIAKKQLGYIPLFGWAMRAGRFIFIDRQNPVAARRSMEEASRRIRGGQSVVLFPEGTRSRDGSLGPFKKGGFFLAINAGASIVPCAIKGTREVMPRRSPLLRSGHVVVRIGTPIPTDGLVDGDRGALLVRVRDEIARMLDAK